MNVSPRAAPTSATRRPPSPPRIPTCPVRHTRRRRVACIPSRVRPPSVAVLALAGACTSAIANPERAPSAPATRNNDSPVLVEGPSSAAPTLLLRLTTDGAAAVESRVRASVPNAFAVLALAYESVGVPHTAADTAAHTVGAVNVRLAGLVGNVPRARYVSCGSGSVAEGGASELRVRATLLTRVTPEGSGSVLSSQLVATGEHLTGNGGAVPCRSTGRLEQAVARAVRDALGGIDTTTAPR